MPTPWSALRCSPENFPPTLHHHSVTFYRRRLPHLYDIGQPIFLTWRLKNSLPGNRIFQVGNLSSGKAFVALDRLLDAARSGPLYLRRPALAEIVVEAIHHNASVLHHYILHAFAVMPNHVHLLLSPSVPLPKLTKPLKGISAKRANEMLALTGCPFWQEESYDHLVRNNREFERIRFYIEHNPVRAGLVMEADQYRRSSAWRATGGSPSGPGGPPHCEPKS